jgi:aspartate/methionine/tyrosine aminotransferase
MTKPSGIRLARRLDEVGFSDIVQIRNKVMEMRAEGLQVHALHGGEPYFETPEAIKYAAMKALVENYTHYRGCFLCAKLWWKSSRRRTESMRRPMR